MSPRKKGDPKADLHVTINPLLIEYFDALRPIHGREYSEFVTEKLLDLIADFAPEKALELELIEAEKKVNDIKKVMIEVKLLRALDTEKQKANKARAKLQDAEESRLKAHRETMFLKYRHTLEFQRENRIPHDWNKIQDDFRFKSKIEAQEYIGNLIEAAAYEGV